MRNWIHILHQSLRINSIPKNLCSEGIPFYAWKESNVYFKNNLHHLVTRKIK